MGPLTLAAIYIIIWWVVLFTILPLGMNQGAQTRPEDGGEATGHEKLLPGR